MQAVILVGGEGTRLRPLTSTVPKPVVPLVDRPFIAFMLEWLRGHGIDDVIMSLRLPRRRACATCSATAPRSASAALRRGARPARHGRRAEVRRATARRALSDAQRRRAHRHRPDRPDRPARADRGAGDARARRRSRTRAPTGWCTCDEDRSVQGVRREAEPRPDRHEPDQRRRLRARARASSSWSRPTGTSRSSARSGRGWSATGCTASRRTSYWLDIGTPERYLQGTFDIIEGNVETAVARAARRRAGWRSTTAPRSGRARDPAGGDRARRARSLQGAHVGSLVVLGEDVLGRRAARRSSARSILERRRDRRGLRRCATASSPPACRIGEGTHDRPAARCSARA